MAKLAERTEDASLLMGERLEEMAGRVKLSHKESHHSLVAQESVNDSL